MKIVAPWMICFMFLASFSGCIASEGGDNEGRYIDDEEDLIDYIEEGICGDIDGDGIPDCPLSGYIEELILGGAHQVGLVVITLILCMKIQRKGFSATRFVKR